MLKSETFKHAQLSDSNLRDGNIGLSDRGKTMLSL